MVPSDWPVLVPETEVSSFCGIRIAVGRPEANLQYAGSMSSGQSWNRLAWTDPPSALPCTSPARHPSSLRLPKDPRLPTTTCSMTCSRLNRPLQACTARTTPSSPLLGVYTHPSSRAAADISSLDLNAAVHYGARPPKRTCLTLLAAQRLSEMQIGTRALTISQHSYRKRRSRGLSRVTLLLPSNARRPRRTCRYRSTRPPLRLRRSLLPLCRRTTLRSQRTAARRV